MLGVASLDNSYGTMMAGTGLVLARLEGNRGGKSLKKVLITCINTNNLWSVALIIY